MWSDLTPIEKQDFWHDLVACGIAGILGLVLLTVFTVLPAEELRHEPSWNPPEIPYCQKELWLRIKDGC